jgi:hydroxymethylpyrimidine kinase/phosphomethylpyrimidine kinase
MDVPSRIAVATVAGSDPTGGAGLQGDLKTFAAHGVYGTAVVTALTVQGRRGVRAVEPVPAAFVADQLGVVLDEVRPRALKTGMLWDAEVIGAVADRLGRAQGVLLVVDPVLVATAGGALLRPDALPALRDRLIPLARVLTPNLPEAARLLGVERIEEDGADDAARALLRLGCQAVVLKGGHAEGPDAVDRLATPEGVVRFALPRVRDVYAHGTGCAFSASLASLLARGEPLRAAVERAKRYVHRALSGAAALGPDALLAHDA